LKSYENVTPVVGSAMSGLPVFVEDVGPESQAAITSAATPTMPANTLPLRFIDLSPLLPYARL